jgi:thiosulfate/3-mercaptopyruvate sulfurtransferase
MLSRRGFLECSCCTILGAGQLRAGEERDPWTAAELMEPGELARELNRAGEALYVVCVAFPVLYRQRHIAGAVLAGPGSKPEGIAALDSALRKRKPSDLIVLYCGCCPMQQCPNIRPAYLDAKKLTSTTVRVLNLAKNFHTDWTAKGYPVAEG